MAHPSSFWGRLRTADPVSGEEVFTIPSTVDTGYGAVRYALGSSGEPRLLVPCAPGTHISPQRAKNLGVVLVSLKLDGDPTLFIDLTCADRQLESVFAELTGEVLKRLEAGASPSAAVAGGIRDFRTLLREAHPDEVSDQIIAGLVGELLILNRLCMVNVSALSAWTGPDSQRHDFRRANHAIEVKTSLRADRKIVSINGVEQLSAPSEGTLVLFHVRLERAADGPLAVGRLVEDLLLLGIDEASLQKKLSELGCRNHRADEWNGLTFSLEGVSAYSVGGGFPAITPELFSGGMPLGLANISYDVDLQFAAAFALDADGIDAIIERFFG